MWDGGCLSFYMKKPMPNQLRDPVERKQRNEGSDLGMIVFWRVSGKDKAENGIVCTKGLCYTEDTKYGNESWIYIFRLFW